MPTRDMSNYKLGMMIDGEFQELHNIGEITLDPRDGIDESFQNNEYHISETFSFSIKMKCNWKLAMRHALYGTNNCRKLHGLPMIRKWGK